MMNETPTPEPRKKPSEANSAWDFLAETYREWSQDRAVTLGAALAFYTTFSLAPLLIIVIAIFGVLIGEETVQGSECGDGPVDATYRAILSLAKSEATLERYVIRGVTSGTEAMGEVIVHLKLGERTGIGHGVSTDIIEASARAFVDGLNRLASFVTVTA